MKSRFMHVAVFAVAMAWVESAVVLDLRVLVGRLQPYQPDPLPHFGGLGGAEVIREAATLVMLLVVGWLAGDRLRTRLAYSAFAFGVWDIFYYLFLVPLTGWPLSLLDWDILFLIPVPWWGPVAAPVAVSLLMIAGGVLTVLLARFERPACSAQWSWLAVPAGIGLILYSFMEPALRASAEGFTEALQVLPGRFNWIAFLPGLALMAVPVADMARRWFEFLRKDAVLT
jgi:hypothetical protein